MHHKPNFVKSEIGRRARRKSAPAVTAIKETMRAKYRDASEALAISIAAWLWRPPSDIHGS
jgi:hypothetical protein